MLLAAADEIHERGRIGDELWARLAASSTRSELIELCMLIGHYEMLAMTLNTLGSHPTSPPAYERARRVEDLRGRRCLITGAASGIGRATALAAAAKGAELHLTDIQPRPGGRRRRDRARPAGGSATAKAADIADHDAVVALAREIHEAHGSMDVVMNIAGVSTWGTIERLGTATGGRWSTST